MQESCDKAIKEKKKAFTVPLQTAQHSTITNKLPFKTHAKNFFLECF